VKIVGIENMTMDQLKAELAGGARFVLYQYCISVVVMSFKRASDIFLVRPGENAVVKSLPYTFCSLLLGWWGIPWGPIWTIATVVTNLRGGRDVTKDVMSSLAAPAAASGVASVTRPTR
jgi:hypothetical protein